MSKAAMILVLVMALGLLSGVALGDDITVLYMPFEEAPVDGVVKDYSGYNNDGAILGEGLSWTASGKYGGAAELDGTTKIEIPHSDSLNMSEAITVEIWLKTTVAQSGRFMVYKANTAGGRNYLWGAYLSSDSTAVSMYVVEPGDAVKTAGSVGEFMDDQWHFLAGTYDGAVIQCFVDGVLTITEWAASIRTSEDPVYVGAWGASFFSGVIDEVRVANAALTEAELAADFADGYATLAVDSVGKASATWAEIKAQ